jgi:hypothetical protein
MSKGGGSNPSQLTPAQQAMVAAASQLHGAHVPLGPPRSAAMTTNPGRFGLLPYAGNSPFVAQLNMGQGGGAPPPQSIIGAMQGAKGGARPAHTLPWNVNWGGKP